MENSTQPFETVTFEFYGDDGEVVERHAIERAGWADGKSIITTIERLTGSEAAEFTIVPGPALSGAAIDIGEARYLKSEGGCGHVRVTVKR